MLAFMALVALKRVHMYFVGLVEGIEIPNWFLISWPQKATGQMSSLSSAFFMSGVKIWPAHIFKGPLVES